MAALQHARYRFASSFGLVNSTVNNPRVMQFALKLKF